LQQSSDEHFDPKQQSLKHLLEAPMDTNYPFTPLVFIMATLAHAEPHENPFPTS